MAMLTMPANPAVGCRPPAGRDDLGGPTAEDRRWEERCRDQIRRALRSRDEAQRTASLHVAYKSLLARIGVEAYCAEIGKRGRLSQEQGDRLLRLAVKNVWTRLPALAEDRSEPLDVLVRHIVFLTFLAVTADESAESVAPSHGWSARTNGGP